MKKISNKMVIAICLVVIAGVIYYYQNIKVNVPDIPVTEVIVAKSTIPPNTVITRDMIYVDQRYRDDLFKQKGSLTAKEEKVLGKRSKETIYKDEPVNLSRLLENEPYMEDDKELNKTFFTISITDFDKALNIKKGDYIDIWVELNENGILEMEQLRVIAELKGKDAKEEFLTKIKDMYGVLEEDIKYIEDYNAFPIFRKLKVYDTRTESYSEANSKGEVENRVVQYLTLHLTDEQIANYLGLKDWNLTKRLTLYGENVEYLIINEQLGIEEKSQEVNNDITEDSNNVDEIIGN